MGPKLGDSGLDLHVARVLLLLLLPHLHSAYLSFLLRAREISLVDVTVLLCTAS